MQESLIFLLINLVLITALIAVGRNKQFHLINWLLVILTFLGVAQSVLMVNSLLSLVISISFVWAFANNARLLTKRRDYHTAHVVVMEGWLVFMLLYFVLFIFDYVLVDAAVISGLSMLSLGVALFTLLVTAFHAFSYRVTKYRPLDTADMPAVTLALPARNETHAISETLSRAVESQYEKLEILVIDDCSQDRTPQLIRDFAHDGIRFIQGAALREHWLGKNASYKTLTEEASGEFILFSGVDVQLSADSIDRLVSFALDHNLDMVSVMPQRRSFDFMANFLQTTRYFFQFILPWELMPINPVLSSLWLVKRDKLLELGGFDAVPNLVVPERYFANAIGREGKYHFIVSDSNLGVTSRKRTSSQIETATRTLYPLFRNNPLLILIASMGLLAVLVLPFLVLAANILGVETANYHYAWLSAGVLILTNLIIYTRFNASTWFIGLFNFPFIILLEAFLLQWSMIKYEYSKVVWKDRNICMPVLNPPLKRQRNNPI